MTTAQKIIKYLAIAFAIFLIVTIVGSIITIGSSITGIFSDNGPVETRNLELEDGSKDLIIKLSASNLKIKNGPSFKVEYDDTYITISEENNKLKIEEQNKKWYLGFKASNVTLYIPEDTRFDNIKIETGAGKFEAEMLETDDLDLSLGAGKTVIEKVIAEDARIETGAGELVIKEGILTDAKIEVGVGKLDVRAEFRGNTNIETGVGSSNITLMPAAEDYKIEFKKGIGSIKYNGKSVSDDSIVGEGTNFIKIDGGIGAINVKEESV